MQSGDCIVFVTATAVGTNDNKPLFYWSYLTFPRIASWYCLSLFAMGFSFGWIVASVLLTLFFHRLVLLLGKNRHQVGAPDFLPVAVQSA
jgi:uncharacterized membrane protein YciS (DUF1049 family)